MGSIFGNNIKVSLFGESHGKAIGVNIDGLPPGLKLNMDNIRQELARRSPGKDRLSTERRETDEFEILSGYFNDRTTGTPLCAIIRNEDIKSLDYDKIKDLMRPSHADYSGHIKYHGYNDYRGGGHFSGRLTAPLVFAGAIAKEILRKEEISIGSHIKSIGHIEDISFDYVDINIETIKHLNKSEFPVLEDSKEKEMKDLIIKTKKEGDSIGGTIETAIINLPAGLGSPYFDALDANLAKLIFSVPGVKGLEFGAGFNISKIKGSEANDEMYIKDGRVRTYTNNSGGLVGGISNGMPIIFRSAIKPTSSIAKRQRTVDIGKAIDSSISIEGRHDPCIVQRVLPVVDAVAAIAIVDLLIEAKIYEGLDKRGERL
ncbi:MAG TPA: chorismate synthase [Tissierellaceae bacterium]|nr:chorismate synthase [Tissierellaceae bacterium]